MYSKDEIDGALDFDLFQGDFGDQDDVELSNKIVTGRKKYTCFVCYGDIQPEEIHRSMVCKFDGELMTYRCCNICCKAMVVSVNGDYLETEDGEDPIDARYALGDQLRAGKDGE
ncbi:IST3 family protein [Pantoea agglomerans]|uniref:IST3 family protein n=1 Tax=Enterobacter agglomerans TaxID=549 RepID=UPI001F181506|nr:IST3 family protein [Pantoea agglomerans]UJL36153.1 hypothetical protein JK642_13495 [Pantoea agglomerans]